MWYFSVAFLACPFTITTSGFMWRGDRKERQKHRKGEQREEGEYEK
jgi:hypothetical protein